MNAVFIVKRSSNVEIREVAPVYIVKRPNIVKFDVFNFARFVPFSFIAEIGQTEFVLPTTPKASWVYVNGTAQNIDKDPPDYSIDGNILTIEGLDEGDNLYGMLQY